jgi:hypothetical protein
VVANGEGHGEHIGGRMGEHFVAKRFADKKSEDILQTSRRILVLVLHLLSEVRPGIDAGDDKGFVVFARPLKVELIVIPQFLDHTQQDCAESFFIRLVWADPNDLGVFTGIEAASVAGDDMLFVAWRPLEQAFVFNGNGAVLWMSRQQVGADLFVDGVLIVPAIAFVNGRPITIDDIGPPGDLCTDSDLLKAKVMLKPCHTNLAGIEEGCDWFLAILQTGFLAGWRDPPKGHSAGEFTEGLMTE